MARYYSAVKSAKIGASGGAVLLIGFIFGILFISVGLVLGGGYFFVPAVAIIVLPILYLSFGNAKYIAAAVFGFVWLMPLILPTVFKITGISLVGLWQIIVLIFGSIGMAQYIRCVKEHRLFLYATMMLLLMIFIGVLSSIGGRPQFLSAAFQVFSDLKPLLIIGLGFCISWTDKTEALFWGTVKWFWIPGLAFVLFEWAAPGPYFSLMGQGPPSPSPDPAGFFPSRALGMFEHPSFLASVAAMLAICAATRAISERQQRGRYILACVLNFALVVCAVQRQEMVAVAIAIVICAVILVPRSAIFIGFFGGLFLLVGAAAFWETFADDITTEAASWGFSSVGSVDHPRAQIYAAAFQLAKTYWPLGTGLGTFAGAGAHRFDQSLYWETGFGNYWWFGKKDYLMDTYWPNSLAESGYIGFLCLLISYALFIAGGAMASIRANNRSKQYWAIFSAGMLYVLLISFSSPAFQDPRLYVICGICVGIAYRGQAADRQSRSYLA